MINKLVDCAGEIEIESLTLCHILQNEVPRCIQHVARMLDDCLPERSHGIPDLALSTMNSTVNYMCGTDGEHLLGTLGSITSCKCSFSC